MTGFSYIEPEVASSMVGRTRLDTSVHPPIVHELEIELDYWPSGEVLEEFPCFFVVPRVRVAIEASKLTGVTFHEMTVSPSDNYRDLYPNQPLPELIWMKVHGIAGQDDFGIAKDLRLVVSRDAELVLRGFNLSFATFEEYP